MNTLLPNPREVTRSSGSLAAPRRLAVSKERPLPEAEAALDGLIAARGAVRCATGAPDCTPFSWRLGSDLPSEGYSLEIRPTGIEIRASDPVGATHAIRTLTQLWPAAGGALPCLAIRDWPDFSRRGFMLDISRDRVPTVESLRELVDQMAALKLNVLQLYMEHTFAFRDHEQVWRDASPLTAEEIQRLDRVVEAFLDYARPWADEMATIDHIGDLVESCVDCVARAQGASGVNVDLAIETEMPPVRADGLQLERVLVNVVQNAYEALGGQGTIRVAVRMEPDPAMDVPRVEIAIEDDGPGMDEATLERAFVPFYTTKERGTGMGLALCERMVRAQNGSIELHSRPGAGTTVLIRLEARPPGAEEAG